MRHMSKSEFYRKTADVYYEKAEENLEHGCPDSAERFFKRYRRYVKKARRIEDGRTFTQWLKKYLR